MTSRQQRVPVVTVIEPPAVWLDLDEVKAHLDVEHTDHDTLIEAMMSAVVQALDGPTGKQGRAFGPQTLELATWKCDPVCGRLIFDLPYPPLIEVLSVVYDDTDGNEQTLDASVWIVRRGAVEIISGLSAYNEVRIRYRAGYVDVGASPETAAVPANVIAAAKLMVGDLYKNRDTSVFGQASAIPMSATVEALLPSKIFALA